MKFTEKQIEKIVDLRTELVETLNAFEFGVEYGKKVFEDPDSTVVPAWPTWIDKLRRNIQELELEEMKIADIDISGYDEVAFYISLGRYFERCHNSISSLDGGDAAYFYSKVGVYQKNVMEALKE